MVSCQEKRSAQNPGPENRMADLPQPPVEQTEPADPRRPDELAPRSNRSALLIVFLVVLIDLLGFGIVLPLLPRYGKTFLKEVIPGGSEAFAAGMVLGLLMSSFSAMQFIFAPIWGRLSDRVGRKPILLMGLFPSVVFYAMFGYAANLGEAHQQVLALTLLFIARIGQGIAGATISTAQAVIADSTPPEKRSRGMALIGAAFGIGFTFGPLIGAGSLFIWKDAWGAPGYVASGLSLLAFVLGVWLLPETLRPDSSATHRRWLDWRGLENALKTPAVGLLIVAFFLATFAFANFESTLALLSRDALQFDDRANFYLFAYIGLILMLAQGGLYQVLARRGVPETTFMVSGILLLIVGMAGLGATALFSAQLETASVRSLRASVLVALAIAVTGFSFVTPSIQSLISRRSDPTKQGEILGVNQSASALSRILGPLIALPLYQVPDTAHVLPYALAALLLLGVLLMVPRMR